MPNPFRLMAVPAFADNYIWLLADDDGQALIVDPGESAPVLAALQREGLTPTTILLTHHHPDHIGGVAGLLAAHAGLPVIGPHDARIDCATRQVGDGEKVYVGAPRASFEVLAIPGHTLSHIAFFGAGIVFAGDTLFSVGCGRMFEGTPAQMHASLERLAALPAPTLLCCGHEYTAANCAFALGVDPANAALHARSEAVAERRARGEPTLPVTIESERLTNPFLRVDTPALQEACARALGAEAAHDPVECFAWLRRAKDAFRPS